MRNISFSSKAQNSSLHKVVALRLRKVFRFLSSRSFAVWVLFIIILILTFSAFLPNQFTLTEEEIIRLQKERPLLWRISSYLSTPYITTSIPFLGISFFLALSTLLCTLKRLKRKKRDFSKNTAFGATIADKGATRDSVIRVLTQRGWDLVIDKETDRLTIIKAHKGAYGFWGSIVFHAGLIVIFVTALISSVSRFNAEIIIPEDIEISTSDSINYISIAGARPPSFKLFVRNIELEAHQRVPTQLSAEMLIDEQFYRIAINRPVTVKGFQFSPSKYGVSPRFIVKKNYSIVFDSYVNLRSLFMEDYFEVKEEDLKIVVKFFPDFFQEKGRFGTKSFEEKNPVFYIKIYKEDELLKDIFLKKGESVSFDNYILHLPDYTHWITIIISKDPGTFSFIIAFMITLVGLFVRFISNERVITVLLYPDTRFELRAWSRYYPAFLEKELEAIRYDIKS